jgi:hypothetical protein
MVVSDALVQHVLNNPSAQVEVMVQAQILGLFVFQPRSQPDTNLAPA